jgi:uncharacterized membrane protein
MNDKRRLMWAALIALVALGVVAAAGRAMYVGDFGKRADPLRVRLFAMIGVTDPFAATRSADIAVFDGHYAAHPVVALAHVLPGALFLIFGALQLSPRFRQRHLRFHRIAGRILLLLALAGVALSAFYFSMLMPFAGVSESIAIGVFGGYFVFGLVRAFVAIRRRQIETHRAWMIRAYSIALAVSTVRLVSMFIDPLLTPRGVPPREIFLLSVWIGFAVSAVAAEVWLWRGVDRVRQGAVA